MKNTIRNDRGVPTGMPWILVAAVLCCFPGSVLGQAPRREASVVLSDGTVFQGTVLLTPGNDFRLVALDGEVESYTTAVGTTYRKVRTFNVDVISEITFRPHRESYERHFTFADRETGGGKTSHGEPYPVRRPLCTVRFNSGEMMTGILNSTVLYLQERDPDTGMLVGNRKFLLRSKQSGEPGDDLSDLVYVQRIKMHDEGKQFQRSLGVELASLDPGSVSELMAITQDTLTKVPVEVDENGNTITVSSTFGENVFLAARIGDRYVAGWPEEGTRRTELFESVEEQVMKIQDYYNERKLLGILPLDGGRRVLTLVSLRRRAALSGPMYAPGQFELDHDGELMEFFRLSVWLWHRDPRTGTMARVDRGSFCRVRVAHEVETPPAGISPDLWPVVMTDGKLHVGRQE